MVSPSGLPFFRLLRMHRSADVSSGSEDTSTTALLSLIATT